MNIMVCLKQTFDTEDKIIIREGQISEDGVKFIINPYDEYALEEAIRLKEQFGGSVTAISVGPTRVESALRTALAMGADQAILIDDERLFGDEFTTSKVLAAVLKQQEFDLILGGYMSVDNGAAQGGARLAEELDLPHIYAAIKVEVNGSQVEVQRDVEGDIEVIEAELPLLITAQQGLNEPRYPSLPGIMKAKKKPIQHITAEELSIDLTQIHAKTNIKDITLPPERQAGRMLQGELNDQVNELVQCLQKEVNAVG
ncbi:electron transfer flavoprotein subunit beta/FixA family protein [Chengkuizengella sediminis]|uniref:electron transfer flavoprotein subunit beta/FixA family protein n=1 Tax=Chengkuizengella sediminis TaxID=1885917 RepID=UPI0013897484|nr:electron transfer flavoprotein subunit beta/FixA family protein [Chengkuizengella sediminis]NDI34755.1 electron transfer flavoprotein subunit beta/FixA family protein [Chengkuizengella sediminis]